MGGRFGHRIERAVRAVWCKLSRQKLRKNMSNIDLNLTTAFLYFIAALSAWAVHLKAGRVTSSAPLRVLLLWLAMLVHALALGEALFRGPGLNIGFSHAVSLIIWLSTLSYVLLGNDARLTRLAVLYLAPFAVVAAALPTLIPAEHVVMYAGWAFRLHLVVAILAYALFTVAALHALLLLSYVGSKFVLEIVLRRI